MSSNDGTDPSRKWGRWGSVGGIKQKKKETFHIITSNLFKLPLSLRNRKFVSIAKIYLPL
jgi:hypothetical protein